MALTAGKALQVLNTPQARNMIRQIATGSVRALGRSRARRANRGKYYVGKKVGIPPNIGYRPAPMQKTRQPANVNVSVTSRSGSIRLCKREQTAWPVRANNSGNGKIGVWALNPQSNVLFPILSQSCRSYTKYRFTALSFQFVPRQGTDADGNVYLAYQPQYATDSSFPSISVIANMPNVATGSIRQTVELKIPPANLNKTYFISPPPGRGFDDLNYYAGTFVCSGQNSNNDEDGDFAGDLYVSYTVDLLESKLLVENSTSAYSWQEDGAVANKVRSVGTHNLATVVDHSSGRSYCRWYSQIPTTWIIQAKAADGTDPDDVICTMRDGTVVSPTLEYGNAVTGEHIYFFRFPAKPIGTDVRMETAKGFYVGGIVIGTLGYW